MCISFKFEKNQHKKLLKKLLQCCRQMKITTEYFKRTHFQFSIKSSYNLEFQEMYNFNESLDVKAENNNALLQQLLQTKSGKNSKRFSEKNKLNCSKCEKFFYYKSHLARHISIVHDKLRPFPCPKCSRKLFTKLELERHMQVCFSL